MPLQSRFPIALLVALLLVGCSEPPPAETPPPVRLVKTHLVAGDGQAGLRHFPGRIDAGRKAELTFRVPGNVQTITIKEGEKVEAAQLVATLDPSDYRLKVEERLTNFDNAERNYQRGRELIDKGAISKVDFDRLEADRNNARTALDAARQDLSYTELKAPFAGLVAKRHIQPFEQVQAGQPIADLQDLSLLEVKIDVPERLVRNLPRPQPASAAYSVSFDMDPHRVFPLRLREVATKADPKTQTFEVTFEMQRPTQINVLPGMSADVTLDLSLLEGDAQAPLLIPVAAVTGDVGLQPQVWVVDPQSRRVEPRPVRVGSLQGGRIQIQSGLSPGERVVTAGLAFLEAGMQVEPLPETEQADARRDE